MSRYRKITAICCAAVFAFSLAACGGGSDGPNADQQAAIEQGKKDAATVAELQMEIAALRETLGLDPDADLGDSVEGLQAELSTLKQQQADEAAKEAQKTRSDTAKALKAAIDRITSPPDGVTLPTEIPTWTNAAPATIPIIPEIGTTGATVAITLKKGDSVGSLAGWSGMDYAGTEAATGAAAKNTGMVRVYSNQEAPKRVTFGGEAGNAIHGLSAAAGAPVGDYTVALANNANIKSAALPASGVTTLTGAARTFTGTFMDATGTYSCTGSGATDCQISKDGIVGATGTWTFNPAPGAMLLQQDADYVQFGWWIRKDKDGPTHVGVFQRGSGLGETGSEFAALSAYPTDLSGKATYTGAAAGKFAVSNPIQPAHDSAGHFTADVELNANFTGDSTSTMSGMVDNFRLNDGNTDPGWGVEFKETVIATTTWNGGMTVWSIGGNKSADSGSWTASIYDDKAGPNNTPDSVAGTFNSSIGTTHSMVGAFGASKQD